MGDVFRQQKKTKKGEKILSTKWYGEYKDHTGKRVRVPLSSDKQSARAMLAELVRQSERRRAGILDEHTDAARTPIADLVAAYLADLKLRGRSDLYRRHCGDMITRIVAACGWTSPGNLSAGPLDVFLATMEGSARTRQKHRQAVVAFGNWLVRKGHAATNVLERSTRPEGEKVRKRRALSVEELRRLVAAARTRPLDEARRILHGPRKGQPVARIGDRYAAKLDRLGRHNALLYRTAFYTGLRAAELNALRPGDLVLDDGNPRLHLPGSETKNGKDAHLALRHDLARDLRRWIADEGIGPKDRIFLVRQCSAKVLRADLKAAGIDPKDSRGRVADFHSLRVSLASHLNTTKTETTTKMEMMRHGSADLTLATYHDPAMNEAREALEKLPDV